MMKSSTLFERGPLPPYVHLASTRLHSRYRCSQALPVFHALPLPYIILNENRRTKNGGGLGTRLSFSTAMKGGEGYMNDCFKSNKFVKVSMGHLIFQKFFLFTFRVV